MGRLRMLWVLVYCVPLVAGHGGILWPPTWQAGEATPIEEITSFKVYSDPLVKDPKIPSWSIKELRAWLTDQAYLEGHGVKYRGQGTATNPECIKGGGWEQRNKCKEEKTCPYLPLLSTFYLLVSTCYLILATCYLLLVTCYLLLGT